MTDMTCTNFLSSENTLPMKTTGVTPCVGPKTSKEILVAIIITLLMTLVSMLQNAFGISMIELLAISDSLVAMAL